jgi:archaellum component FlaC
MVVKGPTSKNTDKAQDKDLSKEAPVKPAVELDEKSFEMMGLINIYDSLDDTKQKEVVEYLYGKAKLSMDFEKLVLEDKNQPVTVTMSEQTLEEGAQANIAVITHIGDRIGERLRATLLALSLGFGTVMIGGTTAILYFGGFMGGMDNNLGKITPEIQGMRKDVNRMANNMASMDNSTHRMANYMESMSKTVNTTLPLMEKDIAKGIGDGVNVGQHLIKEMRDMNKNIHYNMGNMSRDMNQQMNKTNQNLRNMPQQFRQQATPMNMFKNFMPFGQ